MRTKDVGLFDKRGVGNPRPAEGRLVLHPEAKNMDATPALKDLAGGVFSSQVKGRTAL